MNVKSAIQLLILLILVVFLFFFIKNTFFTTNQNIVNLDVEEESEIDKSDLNKNLSNIIINLSYRSIDSNGNEYLLNAESGETSEEDTNIVILKKVKAIIKLKNKSNIYIYSDFAKYNSKNFNTFFYKNVSGDYENNNIICDNLDLLIKDNLAILYNNVNIMSNNSTANADEIILNLLNGNINIKMFDQKQKIKIIKN
tara:strand:+ start:115 stop:708 length:594 start_codon:yes stop_codon:yes gene_type:complete